MVDGVPVASGNGRLGDLMVFVWAGRGEDGWVAPGLEKISGGCDSDVLLGGEVEGHELKHLGYARKIREGN